MKLNNFKITKDDEGHFSLFRESRKGESKQMFRDLNKDGLVIEMYKEIENLESVIGGLSQSNDSLRQKNNDLMLRLGELNYTSLND